MVFEITKVVYGLLRSPSVCNFFAFGVHSSCVEVIEVMLWVCDYTSCVEVIVVEFWLSALSSSVR